MKINVADMITVTNCFWCDSKKLRRVAERKDGVGIQECQECHLLMVAERPEDLSVYYEKEEYFNPSGETQTGYHENYDLISPFYLYWQAAVVEEVARTGRAQSLLEVGCATGNMLEMAAIRNPGLTMHGIDVSPYAVAICKEKGLSASVSTITEFKPKHPYDIVFSAETMEHVDDLRDFIQAVKENLSTHGTYIFYIPAVERDRLIKQGAAYPPLTTSLEHVSYFTEEFLNQQLPKAFDASVYVRFISTGGEAYHLGIVSKDKKMVAHMREFIENSESYNETVADHNTIYNLVVIAAKFSRFDVADSYLAMLEKSDKFSRQALFLKGVAAFGKGELIKARSYFNRYLGEHPATDLMLKIFLAIEREYARILEMENEKLRPLEARLLYSETELYHLKHSRLVGYALRVRAVIGGVRKMVARVVGKLKRLVYRSTPPFLRPIVQYVIKRRWLDRKISVANTQRPARDPLVSVVITYYNLGLTIDETLQSLQHQSFRNFEVILVNDGSTDSASVLKLKYLDSKGLKLKIINQKNAGVAAARNTGIARAKGKYIVSLDADDALDPLYLEKCVVVLETNPNVDLVSSNVQFTGVRKDTYIHIDYNPAELLHNNMVITSAMYRRSAWEAVGGYKSDLGYEDWEFWINLAEHGFWGKRLPELLFRYRTALSSRYVNDQARHRQTIQRIRELHPTYALKIKRLLQRRRHLTKVVKPQTAFVNLSSDSMYAQQSAEKLNVLIAVPWMTFGGAETLIYNFCREVKGKCNLSFVTGLRSEHEWEYKFKEVTPYVYHLANLLSDEDLYIEFISNYITTRHIDVLHVIHTGYVFKMLATLKERHPKLKVIVTMFNDRVEYFEQSIGYEQYVDAFVTDNNKVARHYRQQLSPGKRITVIPNGINCYEEFSPALFDRTAQRQSLGVAEDEIAAFFVGRLSPEKNPDVFLDAARAVLKQGHKNIRFFVIGDGPMRPQVDELLGRINSDYVTYLGYQSKVAEYLSAADVFVLPSAIEGFPLSILEAMAMKVAVIASDVGAVAEVVTNNEQGFVVTPGSKDEIVAKLVLLAKDRLLLERMKESGRQKVERLYSNVVLGRNYKKLYREIAK